MNLSASNHKIDHEKEFVLIGNNKYVTNSPLQRTNGLGHGYPVRTGFTEFEFAEIEQSIPDRFEKMVSQYPDQLAIKTKAKSLTFTALNKAANRVAHTILQQNTEGKIVIVLLKQGADFLTAMLGVLKTGKAYVPMDPSFPRERLNQLIADSQPDILITSSEHQTLAHELLQSDCHLINVDKIPTHISAENPNLQISPDTVAYIIYTSGSTGRPKGVVQNHRNVLHNCRNNTNIYQIGADDRLILLYSSSVMGAVRVIYNALMKGAALYYVDVKEEGLPELARTITQEKITVYHSVASLFRFFTDTLIEADEFPHLRCVILGGEATLSNDVTLFKKYFPHTVLHVGIGSTEAGTMRQLVVDRETTLHGSTVPPGYPVENMEIRILDEEGQAVKPGEIGEIAVRSKYISLGYWQRPELTKTVFHEHPETGERTYFTGDLGIILPDGCLVHRGRKDFQVKIRGFRVELTEIEVAIRDFDEAGETVVVGHPDAAGNMKLIAYVVPQQAGEVSRRELRDFLKAKLPDYMIPSFFVMLEALPRTPNGKVNRQALPIPDLSHPERITEYVPPRAATERTLSQIWSEILGIAQVGIDDNFFELGGHSLTATQVVSRVRTALLARIEPLDVFAAPTIAEMAALLTLRQLEQLDDTPTIEPASRQDKMPLSFSQQRLWFLTQLEPGSAAYHISVAYRLTGALNVEALNSSLNKIGQRHESLRTVFGQADGVPYQAVLPEMPLHLHHVDLGQIAKVELEDELQEQIAIFNGRPFDLTRGPLWRVGLFHLGPDQAVLAITKHHIISDGSSQGILLQELSVLYQQALENKPQSLPALPVQYADFAVWQQQWLSEQALADQLAYWCEKLKDAPPFLDLPADYPRPSKQTFSGGREVLVLPKLLTQQLNALSRHENATLFMTLLAAFQLLLRRLAGQEDIVVGTPIAGRNRAEIENLIGFFINNLVIRTEVSDDLTFQALLAQVREQALAAYARQDVPFEKLLEELNPERDLGRTPIFQVFFNMLNVELYQLELADLLVERLSRTDRESKFDLTLYAREQDGQVHLRLIYNADLFTAVRMTEFLRQFRTLLAQIVAQPVQRLAEYSLVTPTTQPQLPDPTEPLRETWPGAVPTLLAQQTQRSPTKTALVDAHGSWTYAELEHRSNQLAHFLQASGIVPGDVVAVYADRTAALAWALLGIWKAGGAFLILDPAYPAERLQSYLLAAQPRGWLQLETAVPPPATLTNWVAQAGCVSIMLPKDGTAVPEAIAQQPTTPPTVTLTADDLAYLIFTSGTTGQPKGILGRHGPLSHFFPWQIETFALGEDDRFSLLSGLAHDPLLRDLFTPLLAGGTLFMPDQQKLLQPGYLARWLAQHQITVAHLTPALGQVMALDGVAETAVTLPSLRYAFFGGDRLTQSNVQRLQTLAVHVTGVNFYGTTETPQAMAYHVVSATDFGEETAENLIPIGRGIADVQLLVLNANRQLAGIGEMGEIYIRTPYLAQGYLGDASLTTARFVPNPFTGAASDVCYRTGDLGRYTPSGTVMFYGRADRQVKIRGFRIELAEIEAAVKALDGVAHCVVTAVSDAAGQPQLAAYVVMAGERPFSSGELRVALTAVLPSYMIPAAFVQLAQLPVTPNGKIDYAKLPSPNLADLTGERVYTSPKDALENQLVNIWEAVLNVRPIGIHDNYFALGGHSLQTIMLFSQIEKAFQRNIPLATIFQAPTIAELAAIMRQDGEIPTWSSVVPISTTGGKRPFFCVHGGAGHVYHYRALAQYLGPEQPFYGLQPVSGEEGQTNDVQQMAATYLKEIRQVQPTGPYSLGGFCFGAIVAFEMAQQLAQLGEAVALVAIIDALAPGFNGQVIPPAAPTNAQLGSMAAHNNNQKGAAKLVRVGVNFTRRMSMGFMIMCRYSWQRLGKQANTLQVRLYEAFKRPLPHRLRNHQMLAVTRSARKQYKPKTYAGALAIFRRDDVDDRIPADMGWRRLTTKEAYVHHIPGKHLDLLKEPYVQELAQQLQTCLDQRQDAEL